MKNSRKLNNIYVQALTTYTDTPTSPPRPTPLPTYDYGMTKKSVSPTPLPCPFCGERPEVGKNLKKEFVVVCVNYDKCPAEVVVRDFKRKDALARWNRRVTYSPARLKPCPFCGHPPQFRRKATYYLINCYNGECSILPESQGHIKRWVIQGWNRRVGP